MFHGDRAPAVDPILADAEDPRALYLRRLGSNVRDGRAALGCPPGDLARRSVPEGKDGDVRRLELGLTEPRMLRALAIATVLETTVDELTDGLYWNPGEISERPRGRRSGPARVGGYLSVLSPDLRAFEEPALELVRERGEVAWIVGRNIRETRLRRHLTQAALGLGDKGGAGRVEQGAREPRLDVMVRIARRLEVPIPFLFGGMVWDPPPSLLALAPPRTAGSRFDHRSLDDEITILWREGLTAAEIGRRLGATGGSIEKIVKRLRGEGRDLPGRKGRPAVRLDDGPAVEEDPAPVQARRGASDAELRSRLGQNLTRLRIAAGLNIRQLAEAAEIHYNYLCDFERGRHDPGVGTALQLAGSLNRPVSAITAGISWSPELRRYLLGPAEEDPMPVEATFGSNVKSLRRATGLSQRSIATRVGMTRSQFGALERGSVVPTPLTVLVLAYGLDTRPASLLAGVGDWHVRPVPAPEFAAGEAPLSVEQRRRRLVRFWAQGRDRAEIADALGVTVARVTSMVDEMRAEGIAIPYRHPPRSAGRLQVRLRRHRLTPSSD
jgi:transcriptional regulator with XRE-family HTH domain